VDITRASILHDECHALFVVRIVDVETTEWVSTSGAMATIDEVWWGEGANATLDAQEKPSVFLTRTSRARERMDQYFI